MQLSQPPPELVPLEQELVPGMANAGVEMNNSPATVRMQSTERNDVKDFFMNPD